MYFKHPKSNLNLLFVASVLSLRGNQQSQVTIQPMICPLTGNVLLWNGEIFSSELVSVNDHENDGTRLFEILNNTNQEDSAILKVFESIKGPYAFVYYVSKSDCVYFGRDRFGRRSLLISANQNRNVEKVPLFTLTSVNVKHSEVEFEQEFQELQANGLYKVS